MHRFVSIQILTLSALMFAGTADFAWADNVYFATFLTGKIPDAETSANIHMRLVGDKGESPEMHVNPLIQGHSFPTGSTAIAILNIASDLGKLSHVAVRSDMQGPGASWYLLEVIVTANDQPEAHFDFDQWIADTESHTQAADSTPANFTAFPRSGMAPLTVEFTDRSTNQPRAWTWSFGDLGLDLKPTSTHLYEKAGTYSVTLQSFGRGFGTRTKTDYITVYDRVGIGGLAHSALPWGVFAVNAPTDVIFTATGVSPAANQATWEFGEPGGQPKTVSLDSVPGGVLTTTHRFNAGGTFNVKLTVAGPGANNTATASTSFMVGPNVAGKTFAEAEPILKRIAPTLSVTSRQLFDEIRAVESYQRLPPLEKQLLDEYLASGVVVMLAGQVVVLMDQLSEYRKTHPQPPSNNGKPPGESILEAVDFIGNLLQAKGGNRPSQADIDRQREHRKNLFRKTEKTPEEEAFLKQQREKWEKVRQRVKQDLVVLEQKQAELLAKQYGQWRVRDVEIRLFRPAPINGGAFGRRLKLETPEILVDLLPP